MGSNRAKQWHTLATAVADACAATTLDLAGYVILGHDGTIEVGRTVEPAELAEYLRRAADRLDHGVGRGADPRYAGYHPVDRSIGGADDPRRP